VSPKYHHLSRSIAALSRSRRDKDLSRESIERFNVWEKSRKVVTSSPRTRVRLLESRSSRTERIIGGSPSPSELPECLKHLFTATSRNSAGILFIFPFVRAAAAATACYSSPHSGSRIFHARISLSVIRNACDFDSIETRAINKTPILAYSVLPSPALASETD